MTTLALALSVLLLASGLFYAGVIGSYARGFGRIARRNPAATATGNGHLPTVSVIVPARDEEASIAACLRSVLACDYPAELFEVIVVDDLSRDATPQIVRDMIAARRAAAVPAGFEAGEVDAEETSPRLTLLRMPENLERRRAHKKRAITKGIATARGEVILTTDADCRVPAGWIRAMARSFSEDVALVSGPVLYPLEGGPARDVQALEFLGLVAVGAGAIGAGRPNLCNGANVAYRRSVFEEVGGFEGIDHLTSGDDELLMQKIAYDTDWTVRFCADREAAVVTEGAPTAAAFVQQRRRWASKGSHYPHAPLRATIAGIYGFYVLLLACVIATMAGSMPVAIPIGAVGLKVLPEAFLLWPACRHFGRGRLMAYFLPAQPLHLLYVVGMGAAGAMGGYTWKDRRIAR